jgi:hypothetical protein
VAAQGVDVAAEGLRERGVAFHLRPGLQERVGKCPSGLDAAARTRTACTSPRVAVAVCH